MESYSFLVDQNSREEVEQDSGISPLTRKNNIKKKKGPQPRNIEDERLFSSIMEEEDSQDDLKTEPKDLDENVSAMKGSILNQSPNEKAQQFFSVRTKSELNQQLYEINIDDQATPLLYGDKIYINLLEGKKGQQPKYLFSRGYIEPSLTFQLQDQVRKNVLDISKCCFQVLPTIDFSAETQIRKELSLMDENYENQKSVQYIKNLDITISQNLKIQKELLGQPIKYGDSVILLHTDSGMFFEVKQEKKQAKMSEEGTTVAEKIEEEAQSIMASHFAQNLKAMTTNNYSKHRSTMRSMTKSMNEEQFTSIKEFSSFHAQLTPYVSEWTQFQFHEYSGFQKASDGQVYNKDLFFLVHSQPNINLRVNATIKDGDLVFSEAKTSLLIKRSKKYVDPEQLRDDMKQLLKFEEVNNRYIWISAVNEQVYLNVKEKRLKGAGLFQDIVSSKLAPGVPDKKSLASKIPSGFLRTNKPQDTTEVKRPFMKTKEIVEAMQAKGFEDTERIEDQDPTKANMMRHVTMMMSPPKVLPSKPTGTTLQAQHTALEIHFKKIGKNEKSKDEYQIIHDYLRNIQNNTSEQFDIWDDYSKYSRRGIWMIEFKKQEDEGTEGIPYKILLKNVFFDKYLTITKQGDGENQILTDVNKPTYSVALSEEADQNCEFDIEFLERWSEATDEQKPFLIRLLKTFGEDKFVLCIESENQDNDIGSRSRICTLEPYDPEQVWDNQYRDVFQVIFPTSDEVWEILYLGEYKKIFESNLEDPNTNELLKALKGILNFLTNKIEGKINNQYKFGETMKERQNALRSSRIFKILARYLEGLKQRALKGDKVAYRCTCNIFRIAEAMTTDHLQNQISFFEIFDEIKVYISNSRKICAIIKRIVSHSSFFLKKMVRVTKDVPQNILDMKEDDSFFDNNAPMGTEHDEDNNASEDEQDKSSMLSSEEVKLQFKEANRPRKPSDNDKSPITPNTNKIRNTLSEIIRQKATKTNTEAPESPEKVHNHIKTINLHKIMDFFIQRMIYNETNGKQKMNVLHLMILQQFMQVNIDEGIFWNQWFIFKQLYPLNKEEQKGNMKVLQMKTFIPLYFKDDQQMFIGKSNGDLNSDELKDMGLIWQSLKEQLSVIVSLCSGENYICIHFFKKYFTEQVLINLLKKDTHHHRCKSSPLIMIDIRPQVLNLLYVLHITDTYASNRLQLPEFIWFDNKEDSKGAQNTVLIESILDEADVFFKELSLKEDQEEIDSETSNAQEFLLDISNQYLLIFLRCLTHNKTFFVKEIQQRLFNFLNISIRFNLSFHKNRKLPSQTFQFAREMETSKRINLAFVQKIIRGEVQQNSQNSNFLKQINLYDKVQALGVQPEDNPEDIKKLEMISLVLFNSSINSKIRYLNQICSQHHKVENKEFSSLHVSSARNMTLVFKIMNNLCLQKSNLLVQAFLSRYFKHPVFISQGRAQISKKRFKNDITNMVEASVDQVNQEFSNMMEVKENFQAKFMNIFTVGEDDTLFDLSKISIESDFEEKLLSFVRLFNHIESVNAQQELMHLFFNIMNEKKNGIQCLREIILLRDETQVSNYKIINDSLLNLNKYHESSEIWLYNEENFPKYSKEILPNIQRIKDILINADSSKPLYQFIMEQLDGDVLIIKMIREYRSFISKIMLQKDIDSSIYEQFMISLFDLLICSLQGNESKKIKYIDQIKNFYPLSNKRALGEIQLVSEILYFKDAKLSFYQLEIAHNYCKNVWRDLKFYKPGKLKDSQMLTKIYHSLKIILVLIKNDQKLDDDIIQCLVRLALTLNVLKAKEFDQLKIVKIMFGILMQLMAKNMLKRFQVDQLRELFSLKENKIEDYFYHVDTQILEMCATADKLREAMLKKLQSGIMANLRTMFFALFSEKLKKGGAKNQFSVFIQKHMIDRLQEEMKHYNANKATQVINQLRLVLTNNIISKKNTDHLNFLTQKLQEHYENQIRGKIAAKLLNVRSMSIKKRELQNLSGPPDEEDKQEEEEDYQEFKMPKPALNQLKKLMQESFQEVNGKFGERVIKMIQAKMNNEEKERIQNESRIINMYRKMIEVMRQGTQESNQDIHQIQSIIYMINSLFDSITNSDHYESVKAYNFNEIQQNLDGLSYTDTLLELMCQTNYHSILLEPDLLQGMNNMLINGPESIQNKIYEYFISSTQTEAIFVNLNIIIDDVVRQLQYEVRQISERRNKINSINNITKILRKRSSFKSCTTYLLENAVLFIKQLCEGHHSFNQKYLSQQINITNSVNLLQSIIKLLEQLLICLFQIRADLNDDFENGYRILEDKAAVRRMKSDKQYAEFINAGKKVFTAEEKKVIEKTLDQLLQAINTCLITVLEMIQGPCLENQKILIDSQFMEIMKKILQMHFISTLEKNRAKYKFWKQIFDCRLYDYRVQIIKANLLAIIIEMFEGPSKEENMIRIQQSISLEDLEDNIYWFYKMMLVNNVQFGNQLFFNIHKSFDEIFEYEYKGDKKKLSTQLGQQDSWLIVEVPINAQIAREIILESYNINKKELTVVKFRFADVILIRSIKKYFLQAIDFFTDFVLSFKMCRSKAILAKSNKPKLREEALKFTEGIIKSIEIVFENKKQTIYFPKLPLCGFLGSDMQQNFEFSCDRTSQKSKVESLMNMQENLILEMQSEANYMDNVVFRKLRFLSVIANHEDFFKDTAFYFLIGVHIYILFSFDTKGYLAQFQQVDSMDGVEKTTKNLVWTMVGFASFIFIFVILKRIVTVSFKQKFMLQSNSEKVLQQSNVDNQKVDLDQFKETPRQRVLSFFIVIGLLFADFNFIYYLLYIIFAILAVVIHPFFLAFHLADIIVRSPLLKNLLMAIYQPREQLILTIILFFVVEYIFALIAFGFLYDELPDYNCTGSLIMCYIIIIDQSFKSGGGIGGYMQAPYNNNQYGNSSNQFSDPIMLLDHPNIERQDPQYNYISYSRILYDQMFNFFLLILILQIFAGIIIDTFSNLRDAQTVVINDMQNNCFICGMRRDEIEKLEKRKEAFRYHTEVISVYNFSQIKHNHWNYIYYLCFLKQKPKNEYTGVESFIMSKILDQDNTWFPDQDTQQEAIDQ